MDLKVPYSKVTSKDQAYSVVKSAVTADLIAKFGVSADIKHDDAAKSMEAKGTGFTMKFNFHESELGVALDLSFLLKPLKSKVLEKVEREVKKVI